MPKGESSGGKRNNHLLEKDPKFGELGWFLGQKTDKEDRMKTIGILKAKR